MSHVGDVASISSATTGHGLTQAQLTELQAAVMALDAHLLCSVHALRTNVWVQDPTKKEIADCLARELVVSS